MVRHPRQKLCSSVHSGTCGNRVWRSPKRREMSSRQDQTRGLVEVMWARTSTVGGPSRRDVGRARQQEHFHNNSLQRPNNSQFYLDFSNDLQNQLDPTLRIAPYFIDHGARGGAMVKPTSSSDPSIPIGPGLHVVHLSGRGFGQTLVWPTHLGAKRT